MKEIDVKRTKKFPDGVAVIYTKAEAELHGIKFLPFDRWRDAQYGDYAETEDGYITPIIQRNDNSNPTYLKTPTGCFAINRSGTIFDTAEFHNRNSFTRKSRWNGESKKLTANQVVFFDVLARTCKPERALQIAYPTFRRERDRKSLLKELLASKLYKDFMGKFRDKFIDAGINEEMLIEKLADLLPKSSPGTFPALAKMAAAGLGTTEMFEEKQLPAGKENEVPLFNGKAEDAEYEETKPLKLTAVR
jgi:hypothetical protein